MWGLGVKGTGDQEKYGSDYSVGKVDTDATSDVTESSDITGDGEDSIWAQNDKDYYGSDYYSTESEDNENRWNDHIV